MRNQAAAENRKAQLADEVADEVCALREISKSALLGGGQPGNVVIARWLLWYTLYVRWRCSYPEIEAMTGFDQSTIRNGVLSLGDELRRDAELRKHAAVLGV